MEAGLDAEIRTLAVRLAALPPRPPQPAWPRNPHAPSGDPREIALMLQASGWRSRGPTSGRLAARLEAVDAEEKERKMHR